MIARRGEMIADDSSSGGDDSVIHVRRHAEICAYHMNLGSVEDAPGRLRRKSRTIRLRRKSRTILHRLIGFARYAPHACQHPHRPQSLRRRRGQTPRTSASAPCLEGPVGCRGARANPAVSWTHPRSDACAQLETRCSRCTTRTGQGVDDGSTWSGLG